MRISDWSSDVCSSDLARVPPLPIRVSSSRRVTNHELHLFRRERCAYGDCDQPRIRSDRLSLRHRVEPSADRKSVVSGKSVSVRVDLGGPRSFKNKKNKRYRRSKTLTKSSEYKH